MSSVPTVTCHRGGPSCGKIDCARGCCWPCDTSASVPTAVVPRVNPRVELERQLLQSEPEMTHLIGLANCYTSTSVPTGAVLRPTAIQEAAAKAVDDYLLMERKARAWDVAVAALAKDIGSNTPIDMGLVDLIRAAVHHAQDRSTR